MTQKDNTQVAITKLKNKAMKGAYKNTGIDDLAFDISVAFQELLDLIPSLEWSTEMENNK